MTMTDPLGDMLTRIRNAQMRKKSKVSTPGSRCASAFSRCFRLRVISVDMQVLTSMVGNRNSRLN